MYTMLGCSLILHAGVVLAAIREWGFSRGKFPAAPVYSVELVSLPKAKTSKYPAFGQKTRAVSRSQAIPIQRFSSKEQPLSLKKKQRTSAPASEPEEAKLAEEVLSKIERRPPPAQAEVSPVNEGPERQPATGRKTVSLVKVGEMKGGELSQALMLYRALVNEKIERNWALPERSGRVKGKLEAVLVVRVEMALYSIFNLMSVLGILTSMTRCSRLFSNLSHFRLFLTFTAPKKKRLSSGLHLKK